VVTLDPHGKNERKLGGLVDGAPVRAGEIVRVETTGGGGWGDPLEREIDLVLRDIVQGKISRHAAREDYGVVLVEQAGSDPAVDELQTTALRDKLRKARPARLPVIDRGPGVTE
jgi:N-methylhydantoinase B